LLDFWVCGGPGTGKTTVARALCDELGYEYIIINASEDRSIDMIRNTLRNFCTTISLSGSKKVAILDEADYISPTAMPALRGFIEEFSNTCRFILTCNYPAKIIEPLHSRTTRIDFSVSKSEKKDLATKFFSRIKIILNNEGVTFEDKALVSVIAKWYPDNRRILNELQKFSSLGSITADVIESSNNTKISELWSLLKAKEFTKIRKWLAEGDIEDPQSIFRNVFDTAGEYVEGHSIPQLVLTTADYAYKSAFCADQEINLMAYFVELMANMTFK
jgi:replication factor C small subunit